MSTEAPVAVVVTANSQSGSACIKEVVSRYSDSVTLRAAYRTEAKAEAAPVKVAQTVTNFDASDESSLPKVFDGAAMAVIVTPHAATEALTPDRAKLDAKLSNNMVKAAVEAGVKHIVYVGSWTVHQPEKVSIIASRFTPTEVLLKQLAEEGKVAFTSLRSGYFMSNFKYTIAPFVKEHGVVGLPAELYIPACDPADIGRVAAAVLKDGGVGHEGKFYDVSGGEMLTGVSIAAVLSEVLGKDITARPAPLATVAGSLPPALKELVEYEGEAGEAAIPMTDDMKTLTGSVTSFKEWATVNKAAFTA